MAASQIGDLGDFIRRFPQFTYDDYLYRLSMAQVLFLTVRDIVSFINKVIFFLKPGRYLRVTPKD